MYPPMSIVNFPQIICCQQINTSKMVFPRGLRFPSKQSSTSGSTKTSMAHDEPTSTFHTSFINYMW